MRKLTQSISLITLPPLGLIFMGLTLSLLLTLIYLQKVLHLLKLISKEKRQKNLSYIYSWGVLINQWYFTTILGHEIDIDTTWPLKLKAKTWHLVISNHHSWSDIFLLQILFQSPHYPLKFVVKNELRYFPLVGTICRLYQFPFIARRPSVLGDDARSRQQQNKKNLTASVALGNQSGGVLVNFPEGTRKLKRDPHSRNLLPLKTGSLKSLLLAMNDTPCDISLWDVSLKYPANFKNFWHFLGKRKSQFTAMVSNKDLFFPRGAEAEQSINDTTRPWLERLFGEKRRLIFETDMPNHPVSVSEGDNCDGP